MSRVCGLTAVLLVLQLAGSQLAEDFPFSRSADVPGNTEESFDFCGIRFKRLTIHPDLANTSSALLTKNITSIWKCARMALGENYSMFAYREEQCYLFEMRHPLSCLLNLGKVPVYQRTPASVESNAFNVTRNYEYYQLFNGEVLFANRDEKLLSSAFSGTLYEDVENETSCIFDYDPRFSKVYDHASKKCYNDLLLFIDFSVSAVKKTNPCGRPVTSILQSPFNIFLRAERGVFECGGRETLSSTTYLYSSHPGFGVVPYPIPEETEYCTMYFSNSNLGKKIPIQITTILLDFDDKCESGALQILDDTKDDRSVISTHCISATRNITVLESKFAIAFKTSPGMNDLGFQIYIGKAS